MRGERQAQITLFVAVGLVAIIIFGIFYLKLSSLNSNAPSTASKLVNNIGDNAIINQYLTSCLDTVVNSELSNLGKSGGLTNTSTQPSAIRYGETIPTIYGLIRNNDADHNQPHTDLPPNYPFAGATFSNIARKNYEANHYAFQRTESGYFGDVMFPPTCENSGSNIANGSNPCGYYGGPSQQSMEKYFTEQIAKKAQSCANTDIFSRNSANQIVHVNAPIPNVTFTPDMVLVVFKYNMTLKDKSEQILSITRKYQVRYLSIAEFAHDIAYELSRNITFNASRDYKSIISYRDGFIVQKKNNEPSLSSISAGITPNASLITLIDAKSSLDNVAYSFSFLIEHRLPMLEHLTDYADCNALNNPVIGIDPDGTSVTIDNTPKISAPICSDDSPGCSSGNYHCDYTVNCTLTDADGNKDWQAFPHYSASCP